MSHCRLFLVYDVQSNKGLLSAKLKTIPLSSLNAEQGRNESKTLRKNGTSKRHKISSAVEKCVAFSSEQDKHSRTIRFLQAVIGVLTEWLCKYKDYCLFVLPFYRTKRQHLSKSENARRQSHLMLLNQEL